MTFYHNEYDSNTFVFYAVGASWGCGWGEINTTTDPGVFRALVQNSTSWYSYSDVGSPSNCL